VVENFGGSTHPEILAEKTLADGDNKPFLLVCTELIVAWLHGDDIDIYGDEIYLHFFSLMIHGYNEYEVVNLA